MYRDLLLDQLGVNFLGPAPLDLELLHMLTTFHWNALGSTLGWWFCHNNTVSCNEKFWVEQVTVPHPPRGEGQGVGNERGGGRTHHTSSLSLNLGNSFQAMHTPLAIHTQHVHNHIALATDKQVNSRQYKCMECHLTVPWSKSCLTSQSRRRGSMSLLPSLEEFESSVTRWGFFGGPPCLEGLACNFQSQTYVLSKRSC